MNAKSKMMSVFAHSYRQEPEWEEKKLERALPRSSRASEDDDGMDGPDSVSNLNRMTRSSDESDLDPDRRMIPLSTKLGIQSKPPKPRSSIEWLSKAFQDDRSTDERDESDDYPQTPLSAILGTRSSLGSEIDDDDHLRSDDSDYQISSTSDSQFEFQIQSKPSPHPPSSSSDYHLDFDDY